MGKGRTFVWWPARSTVNRSQLTRDSIEQSFALFEKARRATAADAKARSHLDAARMVLQYVMLEQLPAGDPRLKGEVASLLRMAEALEMPSLHNIPLEQYRQRIGARIGQMGRGTARGKEVGD